MYQELVGGIGVFLRGTMEFIQPFTMKEHSVISEKFLISKISNGGTGIPVT